ncbi:MAG TPA: hypothetical protein VI704_03075 [Bacteroidota bacterium]|nr:hypothetical protein [Bacteroidota bacterium]
MTVTSRLFHILRIYTVTALCAATVFAQQNVVNVSINLPNYDVIYVADMIDITSGSLTNAVPNISFTLTTVPAGLTLQQIFLHIEANLQLKGDAAPSNLVTAETFPFDLSGFALVSSKDLAKGSSGNIRMRPAKPNTVVATRLKDYILNFPTAPVGTYTFSITVNSAGGVLGQGSQTVQVKNSSASDVSIALVEPQDAAVLASVLPSFSWTTEKQNSRIKIFEKLPQYQSPQDAVGGIPHIIQEVTGSNFNYPPDARKLEPGKTYYWFVEAEVSTNRGIQTKQSEIRMFRILSNDVTIILQLVERLFATFGGDLTTSLASMQNMGIQFTGEVTKDGSRITKEDLSRLFNQFVSNNTKLQVKIE